MLAGFVPPGRKAGIKSFSSTFQRAKPEPSAADLQSDS
jgi:hypothetical protein